MRQICLNETDRLIYDFEIMPYLPLQIFDAHTHLILSEHYADLSTVPLAVDTMLKCPVRQVGFKRLV